MPSSHSGLTLRSHVLAAKERLASRREKLKLLHRQGTPGVQVSSAIADLIDEIVLELFEAAVLELDGDGAAGLRSQVALVPHGGYGRRDVAPYSDVDLMILHWPAASGAVVPLAERMLRDVFDVGLVLGHSVRTPTEACRLAGGDATIATSLVESRYLTGSVRLYSAFARRFERFARRRQASLLASITRARAEERSQFGETVFLLEPNVKRSPGGLRDAQLLRWIGFARYGASDPEGLRRCGALDQDDYRRLRDAVEFLLRLRNEMHFEARKSNDVLDRAEQVRLAEWFAFAGEEGLLPVEQFMREYFRHTSAVQNITGRFLSTARGGSRWKRTLGLLFSHQFEGDFRVGPNHISATRGGRARLEGSLAQILRLCDVANMYNKPIAHETREAIRAAAPALDDAVDEDVIVRFRSLLGQPARLGELLRNLHELGVLEKIIPEFAHARCLLQFNEYHKFTVDEHCLRAVEGAADLTHDDGLLGRVYQRIKRKWLLHLALLLHDLGKGHPEDHSELGERIAQRTAERLKLTERETAALKFLVRYHLMMSHLAFRRDTSDEQLVVRFAVDVGSPEMLQMLFVLTAADLAAVGPGMLNAWKIEVLGDLYRRTMQHLAGDAPATLADERLAEHRADVLARLRNDGRQTWFAREVEALPAAYLLSNPPNEVAAVLRELSRVQPGEVVARGRYYPDTHTVEYTVGAYEEITPGIFHKLTGALASQGLEILSAEIHTLADGLVFDRFFVHDPDHAAEPPPFRVEEVCRALESSLRAGDGATPSFRRTWRAEDDETRSALSVLPTRVRVDNSTSDRHTILDIFASDRTGLLYTIARTLFDLGLSVSVAKIGTYLDQVVDVFYVTDAASKKIEDDACLQQIRARLLEEIGELERGRPPKPVD